MQLRELVAAVQAPFAEVLAALYTIVRADPTEDPLTIVNPGASDDDIIVAQRRIRHPLHPRHYELLRLSNGGTIPFVISLDFVAAAVEREQEWRWLVSPPPPLPGVATVDQGAGYGPFKPLILGQSIADRYDSRTAGRLDLDTFIVFASGYDGEFFGYSRDDLLRIDVVSQDFGRGAVALDFETFIGNLLLTDKCSSPAFIEHVRALAK